MGVGILFYLRRFDSSFLGDCRVLSVTAILLVCMVPASTTALAACVPPAVDASHPAPGTTVTCSGTTTDQNGTDGYGTGNQSGITINVNSGATVTGSGANGIFIGDAIVNNLGSVSSASYGINAAVGSLTVTNSGSIAGPGIAITANTNVSVTNKAGGSIVGSDAIISNLGTINLVNSGIVDGNGHDGLLGQLGTTVVNTATGSITGATAAIADLTSVNVTNFNVISSGNIGISTLGVATVVNSGSISGASLYGIRGSNGVVVTNNAGASITGNTAILDGGGGSTVFNAGSITGTAGFGISTANGATITNLAGATISGADTAILNSSGLLAVTNAGSVSGLGSYGIYSSLGSIALTNSGSITGPGIAVTANTNVSITNKAGGSIVGSDAIISNLGTINLVNSGIVDGNGHDGLLGQLGTTVVNTATGSITGATAAIADLTSVNVTNFNVISSGNIGISTLGVATVVNSGSISGASLYGIRGSNGVVVTNNAGASITGNTAILADGGGSTVFNAGSITGVTAAIQFAGTGNTLTLAPGSIISGNVLGTGNDILQLGGTGTATFDVSELGPAAQFRGFGTFNKVDSSVWTLTGTSPYAGDINVNGGTLVVNADLSMAGVMMVGPGGTLSGAGTVPFTLLADGATLAPGPRGNGTGMLTIDDRLTFCACSTFAVKVSGAANDLARVVAGGFGSGDAFLAGTVRVSLPTLNFRFNSTYTILTTQGGLNGTTFDSLQTPGGVGGILSYSADSVFLTLSSQLAQLSGLNINQRAVATSLDTVFNAAGGQIGAFGPIFAGNIPQNLTQASGEAAAGAQQPTFQAMTQFMGLMTDPFNRGHSDEREANAAMPFAGEAHAAGAGKWSKAERDAYAALYRRAPNRSDVYDPRWSVWTGGFGGSQTTDGNAVLGSNNTRSSVFGMAAGADYLVSPGTIAGFALAGGGTSFSVANGGTGRSDLFQAGAFIKHRTGAAYVSAALAYGWQDVTTDRAVTIAGVDRIRAQFDANAFSGRLEGGYRFVTPWMNGVGLTPYAAAQAIALDLPAYAERVLSGAGTFALSYAAKSPASSRSELGLRTDTSYVLGDAVLTLRSRAAWAHDYITDRNVSATFQSLPAASFVVNGAAPGRDSALTTASAEMTLASGLTLAATFEGEFLNVTRSYAGKGVLRYNW
jgi:uncharacterized protein with beta-barrel porin domain